MIIMAIPMMRPGRKPPRKRRPTEVPVRLPKITKGMLGGMIGPMVEEAAVTAALKRRENPALVMASSSTIPIPAASATAAPDIPAKIMLLTTFTWPRPPLMWPTMFWARRKIRWVMPPVFIRLPTRMKKGMARRGKPVVLEYILAGIMDRVSISPSTTKKITAVSPMETAMGRPIMIRPTSTAKIAAVIIG